MPHAKLQRYKQKGRQWKATIFKAYQVLGWCILKFHQLT